MRLTSLTVKHVRAHKEYSLPLHPTVTLITGLNGSGKTSLLEAIYIALQGSSFKGGDNEVLAYNEPWYRIDAVFEKGATRTVKYDPSKNSGKKQFEIDNKTQYRMTYTNKYPVVLFEPDELRLINGSPARRRQFLDHFIAQFDPEYASMLRRYERALKQRNMLLKTASNTNNLFVWDLSLSEYGAYIVSRRIEVIEQLAPRLKVTYRDIAQSKDKIDVSYSNYYEGSAQQKLLTELHQSAERDKILGYTSVGPHRHDIEITLNTSPAASSASRGEIRTIILALKYLEVAIIKDATGKDPIILLDDVFSELDEMRQQALLERFSSYQTILTSVAFSATSYPVHQLSN